MKSIHIKLQFDQATNEKINSKRPHVIACARCYIKINGESLYAFGNDQDFKLYVTFLRASSGRYFASYHVMANDDLDRNNYANYYVLEALFRVANENLRVWLDDHSEKIFEAVAAGKTENLLEAEVSC